MITTVQTTYQGRRYEVITDSDQRNAPLCCYAQVYRIRADGSRGRKIVTTMLIYRVLRASENTPAAPPKVQSLADIIHNGVRR